MWRRSQGKREGEREGGGWRVGRGTDDGQAEGPMGFEQQTNWSWETHPKAIKGKGREKYLINFFSLSLSVLTEGRRRRRGRRGRRRSGDGDGAGVRAEAVSGRFVEEQEGMTAGKKLQKVSEQGPVEKLQQE